MEPLSRPVRERLSRVRSVEMELIGRADRVGHSIAPDADVAAVASAVAALAADHVSALDAFASGREAGIWIAPERARDAGDGDVSRLLVELAETAAAAVVRYGALYAAGRIQYEFELCDLAEAYGSDWAAALGSVEDLIPSAIHAELLVAGMPCRCVCPACGIGACLCTRASIAAIREHWGRPGLEPSEGIELEIPPRSGSQLAAAGLAAGDRIVAVDGQLVHTNDELQAALRRHPLDEVVAASVVRAGRTEEILVARVSDRFTAVEEAIRARRHGPS